MEICSMCSLREERVRPHLDSKTQYYYFYYYYFFYPYHAMEVKLQGHA